jgi:hypothetical protein
MLLIEVRHCLPRWSAVACTVPNYNAVTLRFDAMRGTAQTIEEAMESIGRLLQ